MRSLKSGSENTHTTSRADPVNLRQKCPERGNVTINVMYKSIL